MKLQQANEPPPLFTVVVPTRERCDTLSSTLRTCVSQDFERLEIIVSDNFSHDATKDVAQSFCDPRIRYVNTGKRVGMSSNWEFGLSHAREGFITIIGDDDGLLPGSVADADRLLREHGYPPALTWKTCSWGWPSSRDENERNRMNIPLGGGIIEISAGNALSAVSSFRTLYQELPILYSSFVHSSAIAKARERSHGRFFRSVTPDVYSGIALACVMDRYLRSQRPLSINASSYHSNGASQLGDAVPDRGDANLKYEAENDIDFHPKMVSAASVAILTAECLLQAQIVFDEARRFPLDLRLMAESALGTASIQSAERYSAVVRALTDIGARNGLSSVMENAIRNHPHRPKDNRAIIGYNPVFKTLRLDTAPFRLRDIYDACMLCHSILTLSDLGLHTPRRMAETTLQLINKYVKGGGDRFARSRVRKPPASR